MFIWILGGLFCLSFLLSVFSLWKDLRKNIKTEHVTEELSKGRVIFHAPTAVQSTNTEITPHYHPKEIAETKTEEALIS
ncbi:MAG TPA: hypothetical protein VLG12_02410 [Candidatus Saccharimonadales bacterium]|nr:hypothetical protein [Candidatus Saccharimonadales bacterium]